MSIKINGVNIINGIKVKGHIMINGDSLIVDGVKTTWEEVAKNQKVINIEIIGDIEKLETDPIDTIVVKGNVGSIKTTNGDIECNDVKGNVTTTNGDVRANKIYGDVDTVNGDIN